MRKIIFLVITLFVLHNTSYASFPVMDTLTFSKDSIHSETVEQYHLRMQAMGFDISSCRCEDCQRFNGFRSFTESREDANRSYRDVLSFLLIFLLVLVAIIVALIIKSLNGWYNEVGGGGLS